MGAIDYRLQRKTKRKRKNDKRKQKNQKANGEDLVQIQVQPLGLQSPVIDTFLSQTLIILKFTLNSSFFCHERITQF